MVIDGRTQLVGLIGWPVEHSLSPALHNAVFEHLGLNWCYLPLPVPPNQVAAAVRGLLALGFRGANVTVPHKQAVLPFLDEIGSAARAIGAVNTIVIEDGRLLGHNTDGEGFLAAVREANFEPAGKQALVLGAGGAARAVVYTLAQAACAVTIHNRTAERGDALVKEMRDLNPTAEIGHAARLTKLDLASFDLLVNTTPVGMWPHVDKSPWPSQMVLPAHWTVYDLVYNPLKTRLLQQAKAAGARPVDGLGMLIWQGALAFELWTGQSAPKDLMLETGRMSLFSSSS